MTHPNQERFQKIRNTLGFCPLPKHSIERLITFLEANSGERKCRDRFQVKEVMDGREIRSYCIAGLTQTSDPVTSLFVEIGIKTREEQSRVRWLYIRDLNDKTNLSFKEMAEYLKWEAQQ